MLSNQISAKWLHKDNRFKNNAVKEEKRSNLPGRTRGGPDLNWLGDL